MADQSSQGGARHVYVNTSAVESVATLDHESHAGGQHETLQVEAAQVFGWLYPKNRRAFLNWSIANSFFFRPPRPSLYSFTGAGLQEAIGRIPTWRIIDDTLVPLRLYPSAEESVNAFLNLEAQVQGSPTVSVEASPTGPLNLASPSSPGPAGESFPPPDIGALGSPVLPVSAGPRFGRGKLHVTTRSQLEALAEALDLLCAPGPPPLISGIFRRQANTPRPWLICVPWEEPSIAPGRGSMMDPSSTFDGISWSGTGSARKRSLSNRRRRPSQSQASGTDAPPKPGTTPAASGSTSTTGDPSRLRHISGHGDFDVQDGERAAFVPILVCGPPTAVAVTLYCHGNAADLGMIAHNVQALAAATNTLYVAVDYPGYGTHTAGPHADEPPNEEACVATALRVLRFLLSTTIATVAASGVPWETTTQGNEELSETLGSPTVSAMSPTERGLTSPTASGRDGGGNRDSERLRPPMAGAGRSVSDTNSESCRSYDAPLSAAAAGMLPESAMRVASASTPSSDPAHAAASSERPEHHSSAHRSMSRSAGDIRDDMESVEWVRSSETREATTTQAVDGGEDATTPSMMSASGRMGAMRHNCPITLDRVVLAGQSIGTGVVMQLLRLIRHGAVADLDPNRVPRCVMLHSPFTSLRAVLKGPIEHDEAVCKAAETKHGVADGSISTSALMSAAQRAEATRRGQQRHRDAELAIRDHLDFTATKRRQTAGSSRACVCDRSWSALAGAITAERFRSIDVVAEAYDPATPPLPPFLLVHGDADQLIPVDHSLLLARAILRCKNTVYSDPRSKVALALKPGGGHNDVFMLEAKTAYTREFVEKPLALRYMEPDGTPEYLPVAALVAAFDKQAVPHTVASAISEAASHRRVRAETQVGVSCCALGGICLVYGAVALPILLHAQEDSVGLCRATGVGSDFGTIAIAECVRISTTIFLNGATVIGAPRCGLRVSSDAVTRSAVAQLVTNIVLGLAIVCAVPLAIYDFFIGVPAISSGVTACDWLVGIVPLLQSAAVAIWAAFTIGRNMLVNH